MNDLTPFERDAVRTVNRLRGELSSSERRVDRLVAWIAVVLAVGWFSLLWTWWEGRASRTGIRPSGSTQYVCSASDS